MIEFLKRLLFGRSDDVDMSDTLATLAEALAPADTKQDEIPEDVPSYFTDKELKCKCGCNEVQMDETFMKMLNQARHLAGKPWKVNSAYRCAAHNAKVGGAKKSSHVAGCAVDIAAPTSSKKYEIISCALKVGFNRIGVGATFVHLDNDTSAGHPSNVIWTY